MPTDDLEQQIADAIFGEAVIAVFTDLHDADDEQSKAVMALLSLHAPRLAKAAVEVFKVEQKRERAQWQGLVDDALGAYTRVVAKVDGEKQT